MFLNTKEVERPEKILVLLQKNKKKLIPFIENLNLDKGKFLNIKSLVDDIHFGTEKKEALENLKLIPDYLEDSEFEEEDDEEEGRQDATNTTGEKENGGSMMNGHAN